MTIDRRERVGSLEELLRMVQDDLQGRMWTALPGAVVKFTPSENTVDVRPFFIGSFEVANAAPVELPMDIVTDCPIAWQGGGGATLTFPIAVGDECLLVMASRCIDNWWDKGGQQKAAIHRMHGLSDCFALVGIRNRSRALSPTPSTSLVQLRSDDGVTFVELDVAGQKVNVTAPGGSTVNATGGVTVNASSGITLNGPTTINGTLHVTNDVTVDTTLTATTDVVGGGKHLKTHVHSGVTAGGGNTGTPV